MKQTSQVRKPDTTPATFTVARMPAEPIAVINDADLDKVSGGGGLAGGVVAGGGTER